MRVRGASLVLLASLAACGGGGSDVVADSSPSDAAKDVADDAAETATDAESGSDAGSDTDGARPPTVTTSVITTDHRFIAGPTGMFGGWGPHLGHLLRRAAPD